MFKEKIKKHYALADLQPAEPQAPQAGKEKPGDVDLQPGSAHPENWQTDIQSGKSREEVRLDAIQFHKILLKWQKDAGQMQEVFNELLANSEKFLHLYNPILIKGLSRSKLDIISKITRKVSRMVTIL